MSTPFFLSYTVLWILVLALTYIVIDLSRKLRPMPRSVTDSADQGLALGTQFPQMTLETVTSKEISLVGAPSLVVFSSPHCKACSQLYPSILQFQEMNPRLRIVTIAAGTHEEVREIVVPGLKDMIPVVAMDFPQLSTLGVNIFPFAYLVSADGRIAAKRVINHIQHLTQLTQGLRSA